MKHFTVSRYGGPRTVGHEDWICISTTVAVTAWLKKNFQYNTDFAWPDELTYDIIVKPSVFTLLSLQWSQ